MKPDSKNSISIRAVLILLIFILIFSFTALYLGSAFAQETGRIDVLVEGYDGSTAMTVLLFDSSFNILDNKTITAQSFSLENENITVGGEYLIVLNYKDIDYTAQLNVNQPSQQVAMRVFEATSSDEDIIVEFHHVAISRGDNYLNITEFLQFTNFGNSVYDGTTIKIAMPEGFKNFQSAHSCCVERTDFGFFFEIPEPLMPNGTQTIDLKYRLDPDTAEYSLAKRAYYDTAIVIVTVSADDLNVLSTENLQSEGLIDINERMFDAYGIPSVFRGQGFSITVAGYRTAGLNPVWIGTGVLAVLIIGGVVYGFRGTRISIERLKSEEEALSSVLEELEKDFAEGKIKEVEYLKLKLKYTAQLEKIKSRVQEYSRVKVKS
jgi:hypothetical protein